MEQETTVFLKRRPVQAATATLSAS